MFPRTSRYIAVASGSNTGLVYSEAQFECEKIGSGLAIVRNQSDHDSLINIINTSGFLQNMPPSDVLFLYTRVWISGKKTNGQWRWYTGEPIPNPWFWAPGENDEIGTACARVAIDMYPIEFRDASCTTNGDFIKMLCE